MRLIRRSCRWVYAISLVSILSSLSPAPGRAQSLLASGEFDIGGEAGSLYIGDQHNPEAIAFGDGFLVVWDDRLEDREDIFARRMSADGDWLGSGRIRVSEAAGVQKRPAVVAVGGRALLVWEDDRNGLEAGSRDLYSTFIDADAASGDPRGTLFIDTISDKSDVELASEGEVVLAVWEDRAEPSGSPTIMAMRFDANGQAIDPAPVAVDAGVEPVVAGGGGRFMLLYQGTPGNFETLRVQRMSADISKGLLLGDHMALYGNPADEPTIAWDGEQFAAAWIREAPGSTESYEFSRITVDGALVDVPPLPLGQIHEDGEVDLVADRRGYLVVANTGAHCTATAVTAGPGGELERSAPMILSRPRNFAQDPSAALASNGTILVTWEDEIWEVGGNSSGHGENLFHTVGDPITGFGEPRPMASEIGEFRKPLPAGYALVRDGDGIGVLWRTGHSLDTAGSTFYTRTGADGAWQGVPELIGSDEGYGVWAVEVGGRTLCYWASHYWLSMLDVAQIGTGASSSYIYTPLIQSSQTAIASDGEDVYVLSTVPDEGGVIQPVLSVLDGGDAIIASTAVTPSAFTLGGIVASRGRALCTYHHAGWVGRRARLVDGVELEFEAEELSIPQASQGDLRQSAMAAGDDGVELVWSDGARLQHLWIPWGFGEPVVATDLDLLGHSPSLHRDGETTTLVTTWLLPNPSQQLVTWTGHDPAGASAVQRIDLGESASGIPPLRDAAGRLVFVGGDGQAAFLTDVDLPSISAIDIRPDGLATIDVIGPAFGHFDLEASADLKYWFQSLAPSLRLDGAGRATFVDAVASPARFWRGVYRPQ